MIGPLRTLIVDDDAAVADIHRQFVDAHPGFVVVGEAQTGAEAVEQITRLEPDVMLLDFYLPDFSGLEVLRRLRISHSHRIEVIAVTAARDLTSVREARASGVRHYLVKPFTATVLRERLDAGKSVGRAARPADG
jgi:response regulator of citrate/malate metabolism